MAPSSKLGRSSIIFIYIFQMVPNNCGCMFVPFGLKYCFNLSHSNTPCKAGQVYFDFCPLHINSVETLNVRYLVSFSEKHLQNFGTIIFLVKKIFL